MISEMYNKFLCKHFSDAFCQYLVFNFLITKIYELMINILQFNINRIIFIIIMKNN